MAWNEPGGGNRDPWNGKGGDQCPPDLYEVVKKLQDRVGGLFGGRRGGGNGEGRSSGGGGGSVAGIGFIVLLVVAVVAAYQSFYIIGPAERGVVKRFGAYIETTEPGPHFLIPFVDTVSVVNVDEIKKFAQRAQMLTKDENIVDVSLTAQYRVQDSADYLFQDANPENTIRGAMESTLREVIGKSNLDDVITANREAIAAAVEKGTQELLELYRTGLTLTNVNFQDASPPEAVKAAFDDAIKAREDRERLQNQAETYANDVVPRARGAAARQIEDAKAHKAKVVAEAEGESARFLALLSEYEKAPAVTRERLYLDTMQDVLQRTGKVMMDSQGGANNLTYIPLDRLMNQMPAAQAQPELPRYTDPEPTQGSSNDSRARDARSRRVR